MSEKIKNETGKKDLVYSANCMCHIPDIQNAFLGVSNILSEGYQFVEESFRNERFPFVVE